MRHVIALSGGKDSTALALRLAELNPDVDYEYICTPTGNELPEMMAHWKHLETLLGAKITYLSSGFDLFSLIDEYNALPNNRMRWCTRVLKIEPCLDYLEQIAPAVLYVGLRADEPTRVGGVYDDLPGVTQEFPMRDWDWGLSEVMSYLKEKGVTIPKRTDCAVCYHQRLGEWWDLWLDNRAEYDKGVEVEAQISAYRGKPMTLRNASRDTWPASLAELAEEFEKGRIPQGAQPTDDMFGRDEICRACTL